MTDFIAYYRVSTDRQAKSGLGLDAQRSIVTQYLGHQHTLKAEFTEIETGKRNDRPELMKALAEYKKQRTPLIIAKLDRLARNLHFISSLMESGVEFVACDVPTANRMRLQMLAVFAEHEREMISKRTKEALAAAKARGCRLGNPILSLPAFLGVGRQLPMANQFAESVMPFINSLKTQGLSLRKIDSEDIPLKVPSETDLMVRWINDSAIDDAGDLMLFHLLPHRTKRLVCELLRREARNIVEAERIFFLSFVVIPNVGSNKHEIDTYRERKLLKLLGFFLPRTRGLDFANAQDIEFFRGIENMLFAGASHYEVLDNIIGLEKFMLFKQRKFLFDAFFTGIHLQEKEQRNNLFYRYYLIYTLFKNYREQMTSGYLQNLVQNIRNIPFKRGLDLTFARDRLENLLCQAVNIYNRCNTNEREYYKLDMAHLDHVLRLLYDHKLSNSDAELLGEVLSVLPSCFNVPVHTTMERLIITHLPKIRATQDYAPLTTLFRQRLLLNPKANHLNILTSLLEAM